jgi:hypothetical protein
MTGLPALDRDAVWQNFQSAVNMTAVELEQWLSTEESHRVGWKGADGVARESVGHASGRRILEMMRKQEHELTASDYDHMRKVVAFVRRHTAQRPENIYTSRWRYSLMNWGHDPTKEPEGSS